MLYTNYQKLFNFNLLSSFSKKLEFLEFFFSSLVYFTILSVFILFTFYFIFSFKKPESSQKDNDFFLLVLKFLIKFFFFFLLIFSFLCFFFLIDYIIASKNVFSSNFYIKSSGDFFFYKNGIFQFSLNVYGFILLFLALITGFVAISTVNNLYSEEKIKFYLIFFQFLLAILGYIKTSDLITFFFFYEVLMLGSFLIVYYGSYSKKAIQASLYFII